jgi:MOSC domain-containing protein YiiM
MMEFKELFESYAQPGRVVLISIRPQRLEPVRVVDNVEAIEGIGLAGDHYAGKGGKRQVTLIQAEHLKNIASFLGKPEIDGTLTRRNIVVAGINLLSLKGKRFLVGEAVLEYSGECHPCSRMETNFGPGGYNAMRGHGGITAKIIKGGIVRQGDPITQMVSGPTQGGERTPEAP